MSNDDRHLGSGDDLLLGVDIGGTKILVGLVESSGRVVVKRRTETRPGHLLADTVTACRALIEWAGRLDRTVSGIGVGAKGAVDSKRRRLVESLYLGHGEILMGDELERAFGLPVRIENDVHAATIGEQVFGIGRRVKDFIFYNAGTGIAIGIVADGKLYKGASNTAGENGHTVIDHSRRWPCPCGMSGCLEVLIVSGRHGTVLPPIERAEAKSNSADPAYAYLASSILDMISLFDPAALVLGGGMLTNNPAASNQVIDAIRRSLTVSFAESPLLILAPFSGIDAGLVGAAALMLDKQRA